MHYRRCLHLFLELDQEPRFSFESLLTGGDGLIREVRWLAHTSHRDGPIEITLADAQLLQGLDQDRWYAWAELQVLTSVTTLQQCIAEGLLIAQAPQEDEQRQWLARDEQARSVAWWPLAAVAMRQGRWKEVDIEQRNKDGLVLGSDDLVANFGDAPTPEHRHPDAAPALPLAQPTRSGFDDWLAKRKTCRNFDSSAVLSANDFSTMLHRVWGVIGTLELAQGAIAVKKSSPAGGGLHAVEAYVLVQRVEGLEPGLYHYLPHTHEVAPLRMLSGEESKRLAHQMVAGQNWFEDAPVYVVMAARFDRLFWKYRRHTKAWRVAHLDAGHLSQTMYLSAADLGLGAFVTAAINDAVVEQALGLEPLQEGPICIVGFGPRLDEIKTIELEGLTPSVAAMRLNDSR